MTRPLYPVRYMSSSYAHSVGKRRNVYFPLVKVSFQPSSEFVLCFNVDNGHRILIDGARISLKMPLDSAVRQVRDHSF